MDKKKARMPGKGGKAISMDGMRRILKDPDAIVWSNASIAMNCVVRSGSATAWLLRGVYCAYYRTAHNGNALSGSSGEPREDALLMKKLYDESLFAFAGGRALPELADAVHDIVLQALGVRGRPGIAVSVVYGWLAEHLPEEKAAPFKGVDWDALAREIAGQAMAKAEPAFAEAYRRLRELTARYPRAADIRLAFSGLPNAACGLPAFVPEDEAQRTGFFKEEYRVCLKLLESCVQLRANFADMLHGEVEKAVWKLVMPFAKMEEIMSAEFVAWFNRAAEEDALLMLKEFRERFEQSGKSFDVFISYWNRVGVMLRDYDVTKVEMIDAYRRRLKEVFDVIEQCRVVPEGIW